jgi:hypothetical protein
MKKIFALALVLFALSLAATAQRSGERFRRHRVIIGINGGQLTRPEVLQLRRDALRYRISDRNVRRDAVITPYERRKLQKQKRRNKYKTMRDKHNNRRRVI